MIKITLGQKCSKVIFLLIIKLIFIYNKVTFFPLIMSSKSILIINFN